MGYPKVPNTRILDSRLVHVLTGIHYLHVEVVPVMILDPHSDELRSKKTSKNIAPVHKRFGT